MPETQQADYCLGKRELFRTDSKSSLLGLCVPETQQAAGGELGEAVGVVGNNPGADVHPADGCMPHHDEGSGLSPCNNHLKNGAVEP